jgi:hypothetical protein
MRQPAQQHLEAQLQQLAKQRHKTKQKLRALARQTRQAQRYRHGEYVEIAGLAHLDPDTLLGGLCELATLLNDPERIAHWKVRGDARLKAHYRHKTHRRRGPSSVDKGISGTETEGTQAWWQYLWRGHRAHQGKLDYCGIRDRFDMEQIPCTFVVMVRTFASRVGCNPWDREYIVEWDLHEEVICEDATQETKMDEEST